MQVKKKKKKRKKIKIKLGAGLSRASGIPDYGTVKKIKNKKINEKIIKTIKK